VGGVVGQLNSSREAKLFDCYNRGSISTMLTVAQLVALLAIYYGMSV